MLTAHVWKVQVKLLYGSDCQFFIFFLLIKYEPVYKALLAFIKVDQDFAYYNTTILAYIVDNMWRIRIVRNICIQIRIRKFLRVSY